MIDRNLWPFWVAIALLLYALVHAAQAAETDETALWLARSCVGEAGWNSADTGECAAIMHIYRKRGEIGGRGTLWVAQRYSAAIKPGTHHRNRWVRYLRGTEQPHGWPSAAKWSNYVNRWLKVRRLAERFVAGDVDDPLPHAMHYGSRIDRPAPQMVRIEGHSFRNRFYRVRGL